MPEYLKKYRQCHVSNCTNRVYTDGYVCPTHRWRMKKYNSYDLPSYVGPPSTLNVEKAPEWAYGKCKKHGYLRENQMYKSHTGGGKYKTKGCRRCAISRNIKKNRGLEGGLDEYEKIAKEQDRKCAICHQINMSSTNDKTE